MIGWAAATGASVHRSDPVVRSGHLLRRNADRRTVFVAVEAVCDQAELGSAGVGVDAAEEIDPSLVVVARLTASRRDSRATAQNRRALRSRSIRVWLPSLAPLRSSTMLDSAGLTRQS